jgi:hypothetical protein
MISFGDNRHQFNYRAVGIALQDDYVLLHHGEASTDPLRREMAEELNAVISIG